jgi:GNAT superfamily N-acetyltransferase
MSARISSASEADVGLILSFIRKLAEYEKLSHKVIATEESLRASLFGPRAYAEALLAYWDDSPVGFAVFFHNFSTFEGSAGIYLEDLFVDSEHRGKGIGKALLQAVAKVAWERNCPRLEWAVLDWNAPSIEFYRRLGARPLDDWTIFRMTKEEIGKLAQG